MPVKFTQHGNLWTAEVTPPHGQWQSPHPMVIGHLLEDLRSNGLHKSNTDEGLREVERALRDAADIRLAKHWDDEYLPRLKAAQTSEYKVPPQEPLCEAWLAYALFLGGKPLCIREIVDISDFIERAVPSPNEVAWAFLRMKHRGWLLEDGNMYGLTAEGKLVVKALAAQCDTNLGALNRLAEWILAHPSSEVLC